MERARPDQIPLGGDRGVGVEKKICICVAIVLTLQIERTKNMNRHCCFGPYFYFFYFLPGAKVHVH